MSKHTPGKWKVAQRQVHSHFVTEVQSQVGTVCSGTSPENARLIAAAPEMLGKLKEIHSGMTCVCKLNPYVGGPVPCKTCQIGAVIAKAEGA